MRTKTELLREAQRQTASARQRAMTLAARRRQAAAAAIPELEPLEDKVRSLGIRLVQLAAAGAKEEEQNAARTERAAAQKQLETLLADPAAARTRAENARQNLCSHFTWQAVFATMMEVVKSAKRS